MKHVAFARLLPWLWIAVCPPLLGQCGGAVEPGRETGNPPVVEQQKLHIVLADRGVEVVGDAGAVSPGASVRVTNRTTGASAEATARPDGSVSVSVPGSLQDEYEVTVSNGAGTQTVRVSAATNTTSSTTDAAADAGALETTCEGLWRTLAQQVSAGYGRADTACNQDDDCVFSGLDVGCSHSCSSWPISASGAAAAQATVADEIAPVCSELGRSGCPVAQPGCAYDGSTLECYQATERDAGERRGTCRRLDLTSLSCGDLSTGASARLGNLEQNAERGCTLDADCTLTTLGLRCVPSCGGLTIAVAAGSLQALTSSVGLIESRFCGELANRPCPPARDLPCAPRPSPEPQPQATCNAGRCEVTYVPLP
jgi:hypothetical protein